ncbi:hypothetical protein EV649_8191 [Kribbella sp. VKM Ac-2569]|uniref:hypothetical protein n=1 Tax=Kribbella sp. VKM Ac-2569 TaxID=2512220 RepID=UPI00102CF959|nr:hypothetical protein [Kribbella sp. VKM Ac-2569]RZT07484.1 hypothetical protein EV649_8191 [Kribbella sp. VKM Ac-2569]
MHRRITTTITSAVLVLTLLGCDPQTTSRSEPTPTQTPIPTGNLCERIQPKLAGTWTIGSPEPRLYAPLSDACLLTDTAQKAHQIQLALSAAPVTDAQSAVLRRDDAASVAGWYAAKVIDGGAGTGSWALNPAAAAPWLVVRSGGRLIRLRVVNDGAGTLDELRSIARTITALPGELPSAVAMITRPECSRGTAAAERVLGSKIVLERDALVDGHLTCQWGTATRSAVVRPRSLLEFNEVKAGASAGWAHRVSVGAEGWQQSNGVLLFRTKSGTYVEVTGTPGSALRTASILALAQAIAPVYR